MVSGAFAYYNVYLIWKNSKVIPLKAPSPHLTEAHANEGGSGPTHRGTSHRGGATPWEWLCGPGSHH